MQITAEQLKANLSQIHKDTINRWGVSYDRLAELVDMMDNEYPKFLKHKHTLAQAIKHLCMKHDISNSEAIVAIQLYEVIKPKLNVLLN